MKPTLYSLLIPVTSRRRSYRTVHDTDFLRVLLPSFLATATWTGEFRYRIYLGYDRGDPFFDSAATLEALDREFRALVGGRPVGLKMLGCDGTAHAPVWVWNALIEKAYSDGADYFYQIGDDVEIETPGWAPAFAQALEHSSVRGLGVTGPLDTNNPRHMTHACVSRVHWEIFEALYPKVFKNWWSDNWLMEVYLPSSVFWVREQRIRNKGGAERYAVDGAAQALLQGELEKGRAKIARWASGVARAPRTT